MAVHVVFSSLKSGARVRVYDSDVRVISAPAENGLVSNVELSHARQTVARLRALILNERQSQALRTLVTRMVGDERADAVVASVRKITGIVRPWRLASNRVVAAIRGCMPSRR